MRHLSLISITLLIALTGVSAARLWLRSAPVPTDKEKKVSKQEDRKQESALSFNEESSIKGATKDGAPFASQAYQSSDGIGVSVTRENRDSATRASKELQRKLKATTRVIERSPKLDEKGRRVGERVVAMFALDDSQKEQASVLWTNGRQFYYIESLSLKHALEFEKQFYH
ncbi:MAG TPA: hypothetical protein VGQ41_12655 [Pyrinomonadaceae bacterium]|jgi:hypothetical protein|nr:hypothetical protein [Pyrinomonadaceae bacterium]